MKNIIFMVFFVLFSLNVNAETWSPAGSITLQSESPLLISKNLYMSCSLSASIYINPANPSEAVLNTAQVYGDFVCPALMFENLPVNAQGNADGTITFENVVFWFFGLKCEGDLVGGFDQQTGHIIFNDAVLPAADNGPNCRFSGILKTTPQASFTVP